MLLLLVVCIDIVWASAEGLYEDVKSDSEERWL